MEPSRIWTELVYEAKFAGPTPMKIAIKSPRLVDLILSPLTSFVTLGERLHLSVPQFPL